MGVHGVGDVFRGEEVYGSSEPDFVEDAGFMGAIGSVQKGDVAIEVYDGSGTADLLDAV